MKTMPHKLETAYSYGQWLFIYVAGLYGSTFAVELIWKIISTTAAMVIGAFVTHYFKRWLNKRKK